MKINLHILFLCSWYPSKVFPTNGDFIQRHAEAVSRKHQVSVVHVISKKGIKKTVVEVEKKGNIAVRIAYVKPSSFFFFKWIRFWTAYRRMIRQIEDIDVACARIFLLGFCIVT